MENSLALNQKLDELIESLKLLHKKTNKEDLAKHEYREQQDLSFENANFESQAPPSFDVYIPLVIIVVIMESLVKKKQKGAILELKRRHLKKVEFCINTSYPAKKIRHISASSSQERVLINSRSGVSTTLQYAVCTAIHQSKIRIKHIE
ncbi:hypothetical protein Tco_1083061 [Tanacetum coccineum]|uniref:Uncharacterized protein n=1 Tax=Tanacetum coccineum TaxID=301880 RepID=A0ABQ5I258_9ASTR